jgi:hypothetical protein
MKSFSDLKKNRQSSLQSLSNELEKINTKGGGEEDARLWNVTRDKAGNGSAVIRFLPAPPNEDVPFVRYFRHSFQGPSGLWFIENCPTTLGKSFECPVCDHNRELWNTGVKSNQELVSKQKRRMVIVANILVVKDPANPANEGQVKLFKYGKKIHDKITDLMNPDPSLGDEPINPFDLWAGANFKLVVRNVDRFPNYDKSSFDKSTPVADSDKEMERIWNSEHSLAEFLDPKNFKSKAELKAQLDRVLGVTGSYSSARSEPVATPSVGKTVEEDNELPPFEADEDINADFFKKMAEA